MEVKFLKTAAGPAGIFIAGSVHNVSATFGESLVDGGYAVNMEPDPETETVAGKYETATAPRARKGAKL